MKFFALIATATAVNVEGWPTGTWVTRDIVPTINSNNNAPVTWGCCKWSNTQLHSADGSCGKSLAYSTNLCHLDCATYTFKDICSSAADTDRL